MQPRSHIHGSPRFVNYGEPYFSDMYFFSLVLGGLDSLHPGVNISGSGVGRFPGTARAGGVQGAR